MWLNNHRLALGVTITAISVGYGLLAIFAGSQVATVVGVGYTAAMVTGTFLLSLAGRIGR